MLWQIKKHLGMPPATRTFSLKLLNYSRGSTIKWLNYCKGFGMSQLALSKYISSIVLELTQSGDSSQK